MQPSLSGSLLVLAAAANLVHAQSPNLQSFTDDSIETTFKLAIPDKAAAPFPLLMSIVAPRNVSWAGFATGGCMLRSPLLVAWVNGTSVVVTTRWAPQFHAPVPYLNTSISVFPETSTVNATHWTANFICHTGCSDWYGGSIDPNNNNATFGYGASSRPVTDPKNVTSRIGFHDLAIAHFDFDLTKAKKPQAEFDALAKSLGSMVAQHPSSRPSAAGAAGGVGAGMVSQVGAAGWEVDDVDIDEDADEDEWEYEEE